MKGNSAVHRAYKGKPPDAHTHTQTAFTVVHTVEPFMATAPAIWSYNTHNELQVKYSQVQRGLHRTSSEEREEEEEERGAGFFQSSFN